MEFDALVVKESPGLCRCCLSEGCYKDLGTEYTWMNDTEVYADMLFECFDISITQHNDGPNGPNRLICEVCITRLRDACNFKKQVLNTEKKFIDMIGRREFKPQMLIYQAQVKNENQVGVIPDGEEVEYLEDDVQFGDDDPKESTDVEEPSMSEDITVSSLPVKGKRGRPRKNAKAKTEKAKVARVEEKKPVKVKGVAKIRMSANFIRRRNLQILFNNTTLIPFKWRGKYMCFYCGDDYIEYGPLKVHTESHGACSNNDRAIKLVKAFDSEVKIDVSDITCKLCNETLSSLEDTVSHLTTEHTLPYDKDVNLMMAAYRLSDLKCVSCEQRFTYFRYLVKHVNTEHPNNCLQCQKCEQKFNKKRDMDSHIRIYHKQIYNCMKCSETFLTFSALKYHRSNEHVSTCNICFQTFKSEKKRLKHMKTEHVTDGAQCGFCLKTLTTKQAFFRHAAQCTSKVEAEIVVKDDEVNRNVVKIMRNNIACILNMSTAIPFKYFLNRFRCFYCPKDYHNCDDLKNHTVVQHPFCDITFESMKLRNRYEGMHIKIDISRLSCKVCCETMKNLETLIDHLIKKHEASYDKSVKHNLQPYSLDKDNYHCPFCDEVYRYFGMLLKHVSLSHTNNNLICTYCGNAFRTNPSLRAHVLRRHNGFRYKCEKCQLGFTSHCILKSHMGRVHKTKVVKCNLCSEQFVNRYLMQKHLLVIHNTGHKCSFCLKVFVRNSSMVDHIRRLHLKEKNVQCTLCPERFFNTQRLKIHMIKHTGERNYHCDMCGKKFLWKKNLREHMISHIKRALRS